MTASSSKKEKLAVKKEVDNPVEELRGQLLELEALQKKHQKQLSDLEKKLAGMSDVVTFSPQKLRQELIDGIHLLGERVTKVVQDINNRFDEFVKEVNERLEKVQAVGSESETENSAEAKSEFAPLKESKLLEDEDFEIVPRAAIERLVELSRQQAAATKKIIDDLETKISDLEKKIQETNGSDAGSAKMNNQKIGAVAIILSLIALIAAITSLIYQLF